MVEIKYVQFATGVSTYSLLYAREGHYIQAYIGSCRGGLLQLRPVAIMEALVNYVQHGPGQ